MKIKHAEFLKSALKPEDLPRDQRPECAFVGRSNVGKSSLLNNLLGRKSLAKTSSTPGKTQTLNFYDINGSMYFVDLPGYGFAKVPVALKEQWNFYMLRYLQEREQLKMAVLLVDSRHAPSPLDINMLEILDEAEVPTLIVATKVDKLKQSERVSNLAAIRTTLELDEEAMIIPFSSMTKEGVNPLLGIIGQQLSKK
jgi:GTP-binding protein